MPKLVCIFANTIHASTNMATTIPYLRWRERINDITPKDYRIGSDVIVIPQHPVLELPLGCFKVDVTTVLIYDKGWARVSINMKEYMVKAPAVLTILPDTTYQYHEHSDDLEYKALVYSKTFTDNMFLNTDRMHPIRTSILDNALQEGWESVYVYNMYVKMLLDLMRMGQTAYKLEAAKHLTLAVFYGFSNTKHTLIDTHTGRKDELYTSFTALVHRHFRTSRDVSFYADKLCVTVKYLSQVVKDKSGKPALDFIEEYVITECKALLSSTTMTIQQIADALHFPSQSVFGKYFKRVTGISPREYRNRS